MKDEMRFDVTLGLINEMAECIYNCKWVSADEIHAYMASCIANGNYNPEEWSESGKGQIAKERNLIEVTK